MPLISTSPPRAPRLLLAIAALALGACKSNSEPPPPPPTPTIALSSTSVTFAGTIGTANPAPVTVAVTNDGTAPLTGLSIGTITYGAGASGWLTASLSGASAPASLQLAATLAGLAPGTWTATVPVASGVASNSPQSVTVTLTLAPEPGVTILVAGNIARCATPGDQATAALIDTIPGTVFTAGDNAFPGGSAADYNNCYDPSWGRFKARTWATLGNHEYDAGDATAAFDYFGSRAGPRDLGYYSVDVGAWHVIVLNDNITFTLNSTEEQWLRADLAAHSNACMLAIWHQPYFLSSDVAGNFKGSVRKILWDDLYAANADVVVNGHMHHYERMAPMDPTGARDDARGIRQFNSGVGGDNSSRPAYVNPNSEALGTDFGVLRLTLRATGYDWRFIPVAGATFTDSGSGTCH